MRVLELVAVYEELPNALDFISNSLEEFGIIDKKMVQDSMLATEESLVRLLEHIPNKANMEISVKKNMFGNVVIKLEVPGSEFDFYKNMSWARPIELSDLDKANVEEKIRGTVLTSLDGEVKYENKKGINSVAIVLKKVD